MIRIVWIITVCFVTQLAWDVYGQVDLRAEHGDAHRDTAQEESTPGDVLILKWMNGDAAPYMVEADDDTETRLKKQRVNVAMAELNFRIERYKSNGTEPFIYVSDVHKRLIAAQMDFLTDPDQIKLALESSVETARQLELFVRENWKQGKLPSQEMAPAIYFRLDCEIELIRARKKYGWAEEAMEKD